MSSDPLDLFELLDRECARFKRDFADCAAEADGLQQRMLGHALVSRIAAFLLALEHVLYPPLLAIDIDVHDQLVEAHARLKRRAAEALLRYCGSASRAHQALGAVQQAQQAYVDLLRRELYPTLYRSISLIESALLAQEMQEQLEANRCQAAALRRYQHPWDFENTRAPALPGLQVEEHWTGVPR